MFYPFGDLWLQRQFMRNYCPGKGTAGVFTDDTGRNIKGSIYMLIQNDNYNSVSGDFVVNNSSLRNGRYLNQSGPNTVSVDLDTSKIWGASHVGSKFKPDSIDQPIAIYMGTHA